MVVGGLAAPQAREDLPSRRPFETWLPWSLPRGEAEFGLGLTRRGGVHPYFFSEDRSTARDEWRLDLEEAAVGLGGGGEAALRFGLQRFREDGGLGRSGVQDARIRVSWQLPAGATAAAVGLIVKLPNAPDQDRLGTDQTDLFVMGAMGRRSPRGGWAGNLGLAILGSPLEPGVQDDLVAVSVAAWRLVGGSPRGPLLAIFGEAGGLAASRFGNDFRLARVGVRIGRLVPIDLSVRKGLTSESENWGAEVGVSLRKR